MTGSYSFPNSKYPEIKAGDVFSSFHSLTKSVIFLLPSEKQIEHINATFSPTKLKKSCELQDFSIILYPHLFLLQHFIVGEAENLNYLLVPFYL